MMMKHWAHVDAAGLVVAVFCQPEGPPSTDGLTTVQLAGPLAGRPEGFGWQFSVVTDQWVLAAAPALVLKADEQRARDRRDTLLLRSDWTQGSDSPLSPASKAAWAAWRQQLRDITSQPGWPLTVVWPEPPGNAG